MMPKTDPHGSGGGSALSLVRIEVEVSNDASRMLELERKNTGVAAAARGASRHPGSLPIIGVLALPNDQRSCRCRSHDGQQDGRMDAASHSAWNDALGTEQQTGSRQDQASTRSPHQRHHSRVAPAPKGNAFPPFASHSVLRSESPPASKAACPMMRRTRQWEIGWECARDVRGRR